MEIILSATILSTVAFFIIELFNDDIPLIVKLFTDNPFVTLQLTLVMYCVLIVVDNIFNKLELFDTVKFSDTIDSDKVVILLMTELFTLIEFIIFVKFVCFGKVSSVPSAVLNIK